MKPIVYLKFGALTVISMALVACTATLNQQPQETPVETAEQRLAAVLKNCSENQSNNDNAAPTNQSITDFVSSQYLSASNDQALCMYFALQEDETIYEQLLKTLEQKLQKNNLTPAQADYLQSNKAFLQSVAFSKYQKANPNSMTNPMTVDGLHIELSNATLIGQIINVVITIENIKPDIMYFDLSKPMLQHYGTFSTAHAINQQPDTQNQLQVLSANSQQQYTFDFLIKNSDDLKSYYFQLMINKKFVTFPVANR